VGSFFQNVFGAYGNIMPNACGLFLDGFSSLQKGKINVLLMLTPRHIKPKLKVFFPGTPWGRGIVAIASAYRTEDPGFKSRQGVRL
jgi:hypothetical protein